VSYPRNAASPERVSIGAVVQISDGAVQTSGVAVKVIPFGGSEASGDGTVAYTADGVVLYTPVQAETDYTSFVLVASKAGCIPASTTVVTSANSTAGLAQVGGYASGQAPLQPLVAGRQIAVAATTGKVTAEAVELDSATSQKIDDILTDTGTTLPAQISGISGGAGIGARTVTITVNDGVTALQNATVRMTEGANTFTALTSVSGVAVFNLDDATYTVGVTKSGYSYAGTTLVVDGDETATYSMTQVSITPPATPGLSAIVVLCLDAAGQPEPDVDIDIRIVTVPSGSTNTAFKGAKQTATSDVDGIARFEVVQGSICEWKRGRADVWSRVTIDSDSVTNVTSVIGSP
jgi:hypothetical protein